MKQLLTVVLLLLVILVPAYWYYARHVVSSGTVQEIMVEQVEGEVVRGDGNGADTVVSPGEALPAGSVVRTGEASRVSLSIPEGGKVELSEQSELAIKQVFDDAVSFELRSGQIEATVTHFNRRRIDVVFSGNPNTVKIADGNAVVVADGSGAFDVGVKSGSDVAIVAADGSEEPVAAGEHKAVQRDGTVAAAGAIPRSVLLKVDWPDQAVHRDRAVEVRGAVSPGSTVSVDGQPVPTEVDGTFRSRVTLEEGTNKITVKARGLGGVVVKESPEIKVDTRPPRVEAATDDIWK